MESQLQVFMYPMLSYFWSSDAELEDRFIVTYDQGTFYGELNMYNLLQFAVAMTYNLYFFTYSIFDDKALESGQHPLLQHYYITSNITIFSLSIYCNNWSWYFKYG